MKGSNRLIRTLEKIYLLSKENPCGWSDDQIALMLNKDNSEEDAMLYDKMQEWREWSGRFAKEVMIKIEQNLSY